MCVDTATICLLRQGRVLLVPGSDIHWGDPVNIASKLSEDILAPSTQAPMLPSSEEYPNPPEKRAARTSIVIQAPRPKRQSVGLLFSEPEGDGDRDSTRSHEVVTLVPEEAEQEFELLGQGGSMMVVITDDGGDGSRGEGLSTTRASQAALPPVSKVEEPLKNSLGKIAFGDIPIKAAGSTPHPDKGPASAAAEKHSVRKSRACIIM